MLSLIFALFLILAALLVTREKSTSSQFSVQSLSRLENLGGELGGEFRGQFASLRHPLKVSLKREVLIRLLYLISVIFYSLAINLKLSLVIPTFFIPTD